MRSPPIFLIAVVAAIGALHACNCGGGIGQPCTQDTECGAGLACVDDVCQEPAGPGDGGGSDGGPDAGPDGGPDGSTDAGCVGLECQQIGCADGGTTTLTGTVFDPSGTVPLYNALVYVPNGELAPLPDGVRCDTCGAAVSGLPITRALTGSDGGFVLTNVPIGNDIPLVIQMGKWRRQVTIPSVPACEVTPITDVSLLRMPRNKAEGDLPQFAIASGSADPFECLLRKIGISDSEFTTPSGDGRVHFYRQNGLRLDGGQPNGPSLYGDAGTLARYDVVILPCEGAENLKTAQQTQNIIDYTSIGGRLFTTHYGYVWIAKAQAPFPSTADWRPDPQQNNNPPNPFTVNVEQSFPKGQAFAEWLSNVGASTSFGRLSVVDARHDVWDVDGGTATKWLHAPNPNATGNGLSTQHLTFNTPVNPPAKPDGGAGDQCGRVVFSDFHVTTSAVTQGDVTFPRTCKSAALTAQEKALVFMLFDLAACVQSDDKPPTLCSQAGQTCVTDTNCCSGLACVDATSGAACSGGSCICDAVIGGRPPDSVFSQ